MPTVIEKLRGLSTTPAREDGAFDRWVEQRDTPDFLTANARMEDIVIYASLDHVFLRTVIVPLDALDPPDMTDLQTWDLMTDTWGLNYTYGKPELWIEAPYQSDRSKALKRAEPIVIPRYFEGLPGEKRYYEILQKLGQVFELHYVPHKKAWCRLDQNGDLEPIIWIQNVYRPGERDINTAILMKRSVLDEYLLATRSAAVCVFDFTRYDRNAFWGWHDNREASVFADDVTAFSLTVQRGYGSYLRGVQIVRPEETLEQLHHRLTHPDEARRYESFIAHDWKNGVVREISCAPGATANYFTKSDLPFEVTPAFFRPEVLAKYKADPSKYTMDERSISCRGAWHLQTYDINEAGQVHSYLVYLRRLPYEEQRYWRSFNEEPKAPISKRAVTTDFEGNWYTEYNPLQSIVSLAKKLRDAKASWWRLKSEELLKNVHYPVAESAKEWSDEIMELDKLIVEGFEPRWLRTKATELGQAPEERDNSITLLERCLRGLGFESDDARTIVAPFRSLHHLRTKLKGHVGGTDAEQLRQDALAQFGSYRKHFEQLCTDCDFSLTRIAKAFGSIDVEIKDLFKDEPASEEPAAEPK